MQMFIDTQSGKGTGLTQGRGTGNEGWSGLGHALSLISAFVGLRLRMITCVCMCVCIMYVLSLLTPCFCFCCCSAGRLSALPALTRADVSCLVVAQDRPCREASTRVLVPPPPNRELSAVTATGHQRRTLGMFCLGVRCCTARGGTGCTLSGPMTWPPPFSGKEVRGQIVSLWSFFGEKP